MPEKPFNPLDPLGLIGHMDLSYEIRNADILLGSLAPARYLKLGHPELAIATEVLEAAIFAWAKLAEQINIKQA